MSNSKGDIALKFLYYFSGNDFDLFEVKRLDLDDSHDKKDIYKWMYSDKISGRLYELDFLAMRSTDDKEYRDFHGATIQFDDKQAVFELSGKAYNLDSCAVEKMPVALVGDVRKYLKVEPAAKDIRPPGCDL